MLNKLIDRVIYTCKKCGWQGSILHIWEDIKPKRCPNKRCKTHFGINPELLEVKIPETPTIILEDTPKIQVPKKKFRQKNGQQKL